MAVTTVDGGSGKWFYSHVSGVFVEIGWRAKVTPSEHPVSEYVFDVCISADGKRNTLQGMCFCFMMSVFS